jgi:hypothetical protein
MAPSRRAEKPAPGVSADELIDKAVAENAKPQKKENLQQLKNRLRNEAEREVLNAHKDEVHRLTKEKYDSHGLEYVRRLTEEEKAQQAIEKYYQQFPNLRPVTVVQADVPDTSAEADAT